MADVWLEAGNAYPSRAPEFTSVFVVSFVYLLSVFFHTVVVFFGSLHLFCVLCPTLSVSLDCPFMIDPSVSLMLIYVIEFA